MDYLSTTDYLTSPMTGKVESWTHYNEWGEITHNAVLKSGQRELDLVKRYATHDYDSVLGMYYAKARFYDAEDRRFTTIDPILDGSVYDITDYAKHPELLVQYLYVRNNPIIYIDPDGLRYVIDDLDIHGINAAREKEKEIQKKIQKDKLYDYRYYRQNYKEMFVEGIAQSTTTPEFNIAQVRDYNKKIKKCDDKNVSYILSEDGRVYFTVTFDTITEEEGKEFQERYRNANNVLEKSGVMVDMAKRAWSVRYNNAKSYYIAGSGGDPSAGEAYDVSMGYLVGSQVGYAIGQAAKGTGNLLSKIKGTSKTIGYRYVSEGELNVIKKTGIIPNTDRTGNLKDVFISPNKYNTISGAEKGLQIGKQNPFGATDSPLYRVEFDMNAVKFKYGGNVQGGTGIELITEQAIPVDLSKIFRLR